MYTQKEKERLPIPVTTLDRIAQSGQLVVGTAGSMPPLNMTTKDGKVIGLEPDIANEIAVAMGVKATFKTMPFSELLPALEAGKVDIVLVQHDHHRQAKYESRLCGPPILFQVKLF